MAQRFEAELSRLRSELNAKQEDAQLQGEPPAVDRINDLRRFTLDREEALVKDVRVGASVEVVSRHLPHETVKAKIVEVCPGLQELPEQSRRHPNYPQWSLPVLVGEIPRGMFHPGETLDLRLVNSR